MKHDLFSPDPTPTAEIERIEAAYAPLTDAVRKLIDATIRSTITDEATLADAAAQITAITEKLASEQLPGAAGVHFNDEGRVWNWGNTVVGQRNAVAPPLRSEHRADGVHAQVSLGAAYEGPPGLVHGGVTALLLDQVMGQAAADRRRVLMTGTLKLRYRRGTPLGDLRLRAWIESESGRKVRVRAGIYDADGLTVEAEGLFIEPRMPDAGA
ncbi:PaaI family thioesterase [Nocardioides dubius]|uniref:Acyl-coenzyme A thioesterase THEM4 n=1 Tax=Nocardioides dubius TaxID=317019 RepID=A0ABN1TXW3_9ACTN